MRRIIQSVLRLVKRKDRPARDSSTPWWRLAQMLNGQHHIHVTLDSLQSFVRLALIGHIPSEDLRATAQAMYDDLLWRHLEKHGPGRPTVGTLRDICLEADAIERSAA